MTIEVELKHPITAHGEMVSTLTIKRPTMADLIQMDKAAGDIGKMAKLIECCAKIPPSSVAQLDVEDVNAISEAISPFFSAFLATGKNAQSD